MFRALTRAVGVAMAIGAVASCDGNDVTAPPPETQSIDIAVSSSAVTVMAGTTGSATATITRGGGYAGKVTIAVSGLPVGVSASLSPGELNGSAATTTILMTAAETVQPGSYTITVRASSSVGSATATLALILVEVPHFDIGVEPSLLMVAPGYMRRAEVTIDRHGSFEGRVALSVADASPGLTITFDPAGVDLMYAEVLAAASMPDGDYGVTIVGTGEDVPPDSARLSVNVRAALADWRIVAEPVELTVARGSFGSVELYIQTEVEFPAGWVSYSLVDPPTGIRADFEYWYGPYPATMTIHVAPAVAAGRYTLKLAAASLGVPTKTITIGLTVTDS